MPKPPKVVPITKDKPRLIARDQRTQRVIVGIGSQRMAVDIFTRITHLPPYTGDQPAAVLPIKNKRKRNKNSREQHRALISP